MIKYQTFSLNLIVFQHLTDNFNLNDDPNIQFGCDKTNLGSGNWTTKSIFDTNFETKSHF